MSQMKEQVNREVCVTILDSPYATNIEKKMAGICLLLLDECESLRKRLANTERSIEILSDTETVQAIASGESVPGAGE